MKNLFKNVRFYVLIFSVILSAGIYLVASLLFSGTLVTIRVTESYALVAVIYLYFTLLAGPFCYTFRWFPYRGTYLKARRALGVSVFYFGFLHAMFAFFGLLGGFSGLLFLGNTYLTAITLSFISLSIFFILSLTSSDYMVNKLTFPRWKFLHRFVYLAGIFVLIHALMLGSHFSNLSGFIPQTFFFMLVFLLLLEAPRFDKLLNRLFPVPQFGLSFLIIAVVLSVIFFTILNPVFQTNNSVVSFDIHDVHKQIAKEIQNGKDNSLTNLKFNNIPGLQGDRTKRYTVSFSHDDSIQPNTNTTLRFEIYDAGNGNRVQLFKLLYEKLMHLIIVNSELNYFSHIHPEQTENGFTIPVKFPEAGVYHLYVDYQPWGAIEQQGAFSLNIGDTKNVKFSNSEPDKNLTKIFDAYEVTLETEQLSAAKMSAGEQTLKFTLRDSVSKKPVKTLKPYLGSFGHLVMINSKTFDYLHVHPYNLVSPKPDENGGPVVEFLPIGIYGAFKPGLYRIFAQFNPDGKLFTVDFTVEVR